MPQPDQHSCNTSKTPTMASNTLNRPAPLHPSSKTKLTSEPDKPPMAFRFLDLPAELRNRIYELLLLPPPVMLSMGWRIGTNKPSAIPDIAKVNRQIESEYLPLLYRLTRLVMPTTNRETARAALHDAGATYACNIRCLIIYSPDAHFKVRLLDKPDAQGRSSTVASDCYNQYNVIMDGSTWAELKNKLERRKKRIQRYLEHFLAEHDEWKLGVEDWLDVIRLCDVPLPPVITIRAFKQQDSSVCRRCFGDVGSA
ncbi:hypothetical protein LTR50_001373 [Elasticomyces elasticus]|nr:hypothetical protein LTR50_001373 [Elasticomyces elasticus]